MKSNFRKWLKVSTFLHLFLIASFFRLLIPVLSEYKECHPSEGDTASLNDAAASDPLQISPDNWEDLLKAFESLSREQTENIHTASNSHGSLKDLLEHLSEQTELNGDQAQQLGEEIEALSTIDAALQNALTEALKQTLENQQQAYHISEQQLEHMINELLRQLQGMNRQMQKGSDSNKPGAQRLSQLLNDQDMLKQLQEAVNQRMKDLSLQSLKDAVKGASEEVCEGGGKGASPGEIAEGGKTEAPSAGGKKSDKSSGQISSGAPSGSAGQGKEGEDGNSQGKGQQSGDALAEKGLASDENGQGPLGDIPGRLETLLEESGQGLGGLPTSLSQETLSEELAETALATLEQFGQVEETANRREALNQLSQAINSGLSLNDRPANPGAPPARLMAELRQTFSDQDPLEKIISAPLKGETAARRTNQNGSFGETDVSEGNSALLQSDISTYIKHLEKLRNRQIQQSSLREAIEISADGPLRRAVTPEKVLQLSHYEASPQRERADLEAPSFDSHKYGAALRLTSQLSIDGNLDDWPNSTPFRLHGQMQGSAQRQPLTASENSGLMAAWDNRGFYFSYWIDDPADSRRMRMRRFWEGDALELFLDPQNLKNENRGGESDYQFWVWPRSLTHPQSIGQSVFSGPRNYTPTPRKDSGIKAASQRSGSRYTCEVFLPYDVLDMKQATPGEIIGFNYSINKGENVYIRWVTNAGKNAALHPALWGDLLLMGSDAKLESGQKQLLAGESLSLLVTDDDMNLNARERDNVNLTAVLQSGRHLVELSLQETDINSGVFEGELHTEYTLKRALNNRLGVEPGDKILINYVDQFASGGQQNIDHTLQVPVVRAMFRLAKRGTFR